MKHLTLSGFLLIAVLTSGCSPDGRRAGLLLGGDEAPFPADWRFTDDFKEISIQVHTPYLIPHAVTIWCAQVNGQFYVGASRPTTKHWPGWVDTDPNVRLRIGDQVFSARLVPLDDANTIRQLQAAYAVKYQLPASTDGALPDVRYWQVVPRRDAA